MQKVRVEIVEARAEHAASLSRIAWEAKKGWGYPAHWLEAWREILTMRPEQIEANDYFAALAAGQPIGFYGLHHPGSEWRLEHLWVMPEYWRHGIGRRLFAHAVDRARRQGARLLAIEADPNAEAFYLRMGVERVGSVMSDMDGISRILPEMRYAIA